MISSKDPNFKVEVDEEIVRPSQSPQFEGGNALLVRSGDIMAPAGYSHIGSAAVHFYMAKFEQKIVMITQSPNLVNVPEAIASDGLNRLRDKMRAVFGRRPEKRRT